MATFQDTFNAIKALINSNKIKTCENATLTVEESGRQATLKAIHIGSVGASAFSIKLDECNFPGQSVFNPHPSLHRACDALAFCEVDGDPYIICCELKSSEPARHDVAEQFRSAHCFIAYLDILLAEYCRDCPPIGAWPRRYFVFHSGQATPLNKRASSDSFDNTTPETALFIPVNTGYRTYVRQLLGKPL